MQSVTLEFLFCVWYGMGTSQPILGHVSHKVSGLWMGNSFAPELSSLVQPPFPFWFENHWGIGVIPFVLRQASAHVCRLLKTVKCTWTHATFFRPQLQKGTLVQWVLVGGIEIQGIPKSTTFPFMQT